MCVLDFKPFCYSLGRTTVCICNDGKWPIADLNQVRYGSYLSRCLRLLNKLKLKKDVKRQ